MSYLPADIPGPEPTIDDAPFWQFCAHQELRFQRCAECGLFRHPPSPVCTRCQSFKSEWLAAQDEAELFSFTVVHNPAHPSIGPALPYNIAIVLFPSFDNVRLISNVVDARPEELRIGMKLDLVWERAGNGGMLPRFRKRA